MRLYPLLVVLVATSLHAGEVARIDPKEVSVNSLSLGMPMEKVVSVLGTPKEKSSEKSLYPYDTKFGYNGVSFYGIKGKIDFIHITRPGIRLANGLEVGNKKKTKKGTESYVIGNSECHLEVFFEEFAVNEIKMFCAL
jgi:hypothetical protein